MAVLVALAGIVPARAQPAVDLLLVLAVDVSGSVNQTRFELQRDGYVAAFRNARVLETIRSGPHQAIAVTMVQWTGPALQVPDVYYDVGVLDTLPEVELLRERGLVSRGRHPVKVLARGDLGKQLTIRAHKFSGKAAEKIAAAGGAAEAIA